MLVKNVAVTEALSRLRGGALWVGMDVAKAEVLVVVRDSVGMFERRGIQVALESTGTYGEALRQALTDARLPVQRVRSQATSDYAEIFDGVPRQHDGKDAAMLAELGAIGKSVPWPSIAISETTAKLKAQVQWLTAQQEIWSAAADGKVAWRA